MQGATNPSARNKGAAVSAKWRVAADWWSRHISAERPNRARSLWRLGRMKQIIRELKPQAAGEKLGPEQLKGLIRAGYVFRKDDEQLITDQGRQALAQRGGY
jgi:hypothetical protein